MIVTIFKDIKETSTPFYREIEVVFERIRIGNSLNTLKEIREEKDEAKKRLIKNTLPSICFAGKFTQRKDDSCSDFSGLVCLDFDKIPTQKKLLELKQKLIKDKYIYCCFISPSNNGLKALVKIPVEDKDKYKQYFQSIKKYFNNEYFDDAIGNISRVCFESYDPEIYINYESKVFNKYKEVVEELSPYYSFDIPITDSSVIVTNIMTWWTNKYSIGNGNRNQSLFILCSAFNDYGVPNLEAENICNKFVAKDFPSSEIKNIIKSAYSKTSNFGTKFFEDKKTVEYIKQSTLKGVDIKEIKNKATQINSSLNDETIERISKQSFEDVFWTKSKGKVIIDNLKFKYWLERNGFYKHYPEGSDHFIFIKQENNLIDNVTNAKIKDFVIDYLLTVEDTSVYQYITGMPKFFKEDFLNILGSANIIFKKDETNKAYLYFKNYALEISKDEIKTIDYIDLNGYVWKKQIIDFEYKDASFKGCDFEKFINNISDENENKILAFKTAIGYLLHSFNSVSKTMAIIFNDEFISDNPEGGTGKGIIINAISKLKNVAVIDGKNFRFDSSFPYQTVSADTQLIVFDDVKKDFEFQNLFSVITEGITLEKKNKDAIKIPKDKSPKVAITTNYSIKGQGNSNERRKWELELSKHYSRTHTPEDEFKHALFEGWDELEWSKFYSFMIDCLQTYLKIGLVAGKFNNIGLRKFITETSHEFYEWTQEGNIPTDIKINRIEKYELMIKDYPDLKKWLTQKRFKMWIDSYGKYLGVEAKSGTTAGLRWSYIPTKSEVITEEQEIEMPF